MIRKSRDLNKLSDEEFNKIIIPFDNKIRKYIMNEVLNEFVAFYISTAYEMDALWDSKFKLTCESAIESLCQISSDSYNKNEVKRILKDKYKLEVVSEDPTGIRKVNHE